MCKDRPTLLNLYISWLDLRGMTKKIFLFVKIIKKMFGK